MESLLSTVRTSSFGAPSPALDVAATGSPALLRSLCQLDSLLLTLDHLQLDFFLSLRSFAHCDLFLPPLDPAHTEALSSMRAFANSEFLMLTSGRAKPGLSISALDFVTAEETLFVQNVQRLSSTLLVESLTVGPSLLPRKLGCAEPVVSLYGAGCSEVFLPILTALPLESSSFLRSHAYFDSLILTLGNSKTGAKLPVLGSSHLDFCMFLRNFGRSDPTTSAPDCSRFGLCLFPKGLQRLELLLLALKMVYLASSLPAMDSHFIDSSLSLQGVGQAGPVISLFGAACLAALLFIFDFHQIGSSLSTQSFAHPGSVSFALDPTSFGFSLILRSGFRLEFSLPPFCANRLELPLLAFDSLHLDLCLTVRSFRLGLVSLLFAAARTGPSVSVFDGQSSGSPTLLQSMTCPDAFMSTLSAANFEFLIFILSAGLSDFFISSRSLAHLEPCLSTGSLARFGVSMSPLDVIEMEFSLSPKSHLWYLSGSSANFKDVSATSRYFKSQSTSGLKARQTKARFCKQVKTFCSIVLNDIVSLLSCCI